MTKEPWLLSSSVAYAGRVNGQSFDPFGRPGPAAVGKIHDQVLLRQQSIPDA
jgi:hypothetical protein